MTKVLGCLLAKGGFAISVDDFDSEIIVIGSGFGGSVAALRFADEGSSVLVLERGNFVSRANFSVNLDIFWKPERNTFGFHDIRKRGNTVIPWLGAAVGGGSHVYAGTLKRRETFEDFPEDISNEEMAPYYEVAESMMAAMPYPEYPPYNEVRTTQLCFRAGARLKAQYPKLVQSYGPLNLGISFAPPDGEPGGMFVNKHGARQRYQDPREQSILGGDIDVKNTLDKNYLFLAQKKGARIKPLHEVDKVEPIAGGYRIHCREYLLDEKIRRSPKYRIVSYTARRVVVAAGAVGSTELLLRNRDLHKTLPQLSQKLGHRYTTNGDWITLMIPFREIALAWLGFFGMLAMLITNHFFFMIPFALIYYAALIRSKPYDPDLGTTNSDFIQFVGRHGENQGVYIESGRYPNPGKGLIAFFLSLAHAYTPSRYIAISNAARLLRAIVPPLGALARSWPIPLLTMGGDDGVGIIELTDNKRAIIRFDPEHNKDYYAYVSDLGKRIARVIGALWIPNLSFMLSKSIVVTHNQGGVPMGDSIESGAVDHCGRVFGCKNLMVLDGSIIPVSPRPNPSLTILALSERAMNHVIRQIRATGNITAEVTNKTLSPN